MSADLASTDDVNRTRDTVGWFLGIVVATALILMLGNAWLDSRKSPTIIFMADQNTLVAADVRGAVSTPGVVYLEPGGRMIDAIEASGGLAPDADRSLINLSARVGDGQMIVIPTQAPAESVTTSGRININTASIEQLKELPGIGDVLAQRIVAYREFNGPFQRAEDLAEVEGISPSVVESLLPYISVTGDD